MQKASGQKPAQQIMQFNVAQLLQQPANATRTYNLDNITLPNPPDNLVLQHPLSGYIKLTKGGNAIVVSGKLDAVLNLSCTRCLTPVDAPVSMEIEETFNPTVDVTTGIKLTVAHGTDPATLITEAHIVDLSEVVRQSLYLAQPARILCKPNCLGLCPHCGQNKNEAVCSCTDDRIDSRWAGLPAIKDDYA